MSDSDSEHASKCKFCHGLGASEHIWANGWKQSYQCNDCGGAGWTRTCEECNGRGHVLKTFQGVGQAWFQCSHCKGCGKFQAPQSIQAPRKRLRAMCKDEMQEELRKMGRKVAGNKLDLQKRLEDVFETNSRGWATKCISTCSRGRYLESGSFRDVFLMDYMKGPRKGQQGVYKLFRDPECQFDRQAFTREIQAVKRSGQIIKAFNAFNERITNKRGVGARRRVYLNLPEIWKIGDTKVFVEPLIEGKYSKFNSNSGWVNEGYHMMQALSHFSYHHSKGRYLLCDLQGGGYDTHYVLTDPAVLSVNHEFGDTDGGLEFMETFFATHVCGDYCDPTWRCMDCARPRVPVRSGTTFVPRVAGRSTAIDAIRNAGFYR